MSSDARADVYGIGNAIVDLEVAVDDELIERAGLTKGHMTLVDSRRQAELLGALQGHSTQRCSGGSVANILQSSA